MALGTVGALVAGSIGSSVVGGVAANRAADAQTDAANAANATQLEMFNRTVDLTEPQREVGNNALAAMAYELGIGERPTFGGTAPDITERTINNFETVMMPSEGRDGLPVSSQNALAPSTEYLVGGQVFGSRDDAEAYADANRTGGFEYGGFQTSPGYQFRLNEGQNALANMASARGLRLSGNTMRDAMTYGQGMASNEYGNFWNRLAGLGGAGQTATGQQINAGANYANAFGANALAGGQARASGYQGINSAFQGGMNNLFNIMGMQQAGYFS